MMVLRPVFTVGFLAAAWTQERGGVPELRHLFRGFGSNLWALLPVGIMLVAGLMLAVLSTALVDGGALLDALTSNTKPDEALVVDSRVEGAMLLGIVVALPTILADLVRAGADRVPGLRAPSGDADEPARRARQLATRGDVRPAALLLRSGAAGNRDRHHRARDAAAWPRATSSRSPSCRISCCSPPRRRSRTTSPTATSSMRARRARNRPRRTRSAELRSSRRNAAVAAARHARYVRPPRASRIRAPAT